MAEGDAEAVRAEKSIALVKTRSEKLQKKKKPVLKLIKKSIKKNACCVNKSKAESQEMVIWLSISIIRYSKDSAEVNEQMGTVLYIHSKNIVWEVVHKCFWLKKVNH